METRVRDISKDPELDYDNWYVCAHCGQEQVPFEGEEVTLDKMLMCQSCQDDNWLDDYDEPYL